MEIKQFVDICIKELTSSKEIDYSEQEARAIANRVLQDCYGVPSYYYLTNPNYDIAPYNQYSKNQIIERNIKVSNDELLEIVEKLKSGEPLQYITGFEYFAGSKFRVGEGVLIPRPETEQLVEIVTKKINDYIVESGCFRLIDFCCGSGCIAWSIAKYLSENKVNYKVEILGYDISDKALDYARSQKIFHPDNLSAQSVFIPKFVKADLFTLKNIEEDFSSSCSNHTADEGKPEVLSLDLKSDMKDGSAKVDFIVSNPPYILNQEKKSMRLNVSKFEPKEALFVEDDAPLIFYDRISSIASNILKSGGWLYFECNPINIFQIKEILESKSFINVEVFNDFASLPRFIKGQK